MTLVGKATHSVVVDPIDGTLYAYLERKGPYAVMVGFARTDRYVASLVAFPRETPALRHRERPCTGEARA